MSNIGYEFVSVEIDGVMCKAIKEKDGSLSGISPVVTNADGRQVAISYGASREKRDSYDVLAMVPQSIYDRYIKEATSWIDLLNEHRRIAGKPYEYLFHIAGPLYSKEEQDEMFGRLT